MNLNIDGFRRGVSASAAVEFMLIAPVALLLLIGASQVADGMIASRRVTAVTKTLVNLVSLQGTTTQASSTPTPGNAVSAATLSNLLTGAASILSPYPQSPLKITISAIDVGNTAAGTCCSALVRWSYTQGGTLRPCVSQLTALSNELDYSPDQLPADLLPTGTKLPSPRYIIISDVEYKFTPVVTSKTISFAPTMRRSQYMFPRSSGQVVTDKLPAVGSRYGQVCF